MASIRDAFKSKIPSLREDVERLVAEHGDKVIAEATVAQAYGGMRGLRCMVCDTSLVKPDKGLILRGTPLSELTHLSPEDEFYLLLTGDIPDKAASKELGDELASRSHVPDYVFDVIRAVPKTSHPMAMLSMAVLALEEGSKFRAAYNEGVRKEEYWESVLDDSLDLIAKLPTVAAAVYRVRYDLGDLIPRDPNLDWSANFTHMMGVPDTTGTLGELTRLYLMIHADHEGGNVSANLCHTAGSALSDSYYSVAAGLCGLAGPLHGLANQECLRFHLQIMEKFGGVPSKDQLKEYAWEILNSGRVIPGFGHAVLRETDPRYTALHEFAMKACPDAELFKLANTMYEVIPGVLTEHGKAKNVNPNVDALSGVLLYEYGIKQPRFYTAIFGVSRALGMLAQLVVNRAMKTPITRPKSVSTAWIKEQVGAK
ncbi:MAG: citrate (Si)-synthase [Planctomycetes bacterium]|nr:citrate (Si)-synthase [Planctomycetota bacterium]